MTGQREADERSYDATPKQRAGVRIYDRPEGLARFPRLWLAVWFLVLLVLMIVAIVLWRR